MAQASATAVAEAALRDKRQAVVAGLNRLDYVSAHPS
jgi:hypothetical protein